MLVAVDGPPTTFGPRHVYGRWKARLDDDDDDSHWLLASHVAPHAENGFGHLGITKIFSNISSDFDSECAVCMFTLTSNLRGKRDKMVE